MKITAFFLASMFFIACNPKPGQSGSSNMNPIQNETIKGHAFLDCMYGDDYFPDHLVDKGVVILKDLCQKIEVEKPKDLPDLYKLTHTATNSFNDLEDEFFANGSEIETAARECIAADFEFIAKTYGYEDADIEELIATRNW